MQSSTDQNNPSTLPKGLVEELRKAKGKHMREVGEIHHRRMLKGISEITDKINDLENDLKNLRESPWYSHRVEEYNQGLTTKDLRPYVHNIEFAIRQLSNSTDDVYGEILDCADDQDEE